MTLTGGLGSAAATASTAAAGTAAPTTSESAKLDRVPVPDLAWFNCYRTAQCATVRVPLDYDEPDGRTTTVAALRLPATGDKIGTLFVNPGGPGGSSTELAYAADRWLSPAVRERFDIVGIDPRGVGFSEQVQCLPVEQQDDVLRGLGSGVPVSATEERDYMRSIRTVAAGCSTNDLATSMSSAEVARDMEMVRRALGERRLNYLGFSYGSHLGTTYATMFPDTFRSLVVDGTISPTGWSGLGSLKSQPLEARLKSGKAGWKAIRRVLAECDRVGTSRCDFAAGNPQARFDTLMRRLRTTPIEIADPDGGEPLVVTYADAVQILLMALYMPDAPQFSTFVLEMLSQLQRQGGGSLAAVADKQSARRLERVIRDADAALRRGFTYDNSLDSYLSVMCTDTRETTALADYPTFAETQDTVAPHFGRAWLWSSAGCAGDSFTGEDEDAWHGPWGTSTTKHVLVVGNYWDPATAYGGAVQAHHVLGRSRLVSSDSWGHTAYGVSACVTRRVDSALLTGRVPTSDVQCPAERPMFPTAEQMRNGASAARSATPTSVPDIARSVELPTMSDPRQRFPRPTVR
ncbi:alpha/beta hydrolase [Janibacter sp. G1551]|uniref:alpha/beta hydrolase n=1 Tax=Janibacter sp. G1551 TaxID=3420440 RepID=UPI003D081F83